MVDTIIDAIGEIQSKFQTLFPDVNHYVHIEMDNGCSGVFFCICESKLNFELLNDFNSSIQNEFSIKINNVMLHKATGCRFIANDRYHWHLRIELVNLWCEKNG